MSGPLRHPRDICALGGCELCGPTVYEVLRDIRTGTVPLMPGGGPALTRLRRVEQELDAVLRESERREETVARNVQERDRALDACDALREQRDLARAEVVSARTNLAAERALVEQLRADYSDAADENARLRGHLVDVRAAGAEQVRAAREAANTPTSKEKSMSKTAYVSIGNSDDKLTQREWATFVRQTFDAVFEHATTIHGSWISASDSEWQNACWCIVVHELQEAALKKQLGHLAREFRQDSIAWAEVTQTEFLGGEGGNDTAEAAS